jgi:sarcosine dehydrogenase
LFHNCGFNSAGMMLGAGCAKQLASWIIHDRPDLHMFAYDVRRFTPKQKKAYDWAVERSHESYAKNYSIVFPNDQPLAGRNFIQDPFHKVTLKEPKCRNRSIDFSLSSRASDTRKLRRCHGGEER